MKKFLFGFLMMLWAGIAFAAQSQAPVAPGMQQFADGNGAPYAGGKLYFYAPGTTTPKNTWQDPNGTSLNVNPVTLDANGRAIIWGSGLYRQVLKDQFGNTIWDQIASAPQVGDFLVNGGPLGTPSSGDLRNTTNLPVATGISGLGSGVATALAQGANTRNGFTTGAGVGVNVVDFGADPTGVADSTAAFQAAIAALPSGGRIRVPNGQFKASQIVLTAVGQALVCDSRQGTFLNQSDAALDFVVLTNQFQKVENCSFFPSVRKTAGAQIRMQLGCYTCEVRHVSIQYGFLGIDQISATGGIIEDVTVRYLLGGIGILYEGTASAQSFGLTIRDATMDNPYPLSPGAVVNWSAALAVTAGQITTKNGVIWQASGNCTTGASGPSGLPSGSTPASVFTTTVADGTCNWYWVASSNLTWIVWDSYAYTLTVDDTALIDGAAGLIIQDTVAAGDSYPKFSHFSNVQTDHTVLSGTIATAGTDLVFVNCWMGSSLTGNGLVISPGVRGGVQVIGGRYAGNWSSGISLNAGFNSSISGAMVTSNSQAGSGTFPNISVAADIGRFTIVNNTLGQDPDSGGGSPANNASYGVQVLAGTSDYYTVTGNICGGTTWTGTCASDGGSGVNKTFSGNY